MILGKRNKGAHVAVGLDVGSQSIRIVALTRPAQDRPLLRAAAVEPLPEGVPVEDVLRALRTRFPVRSNRVHCNLGPVNVIVHEAQFPRLPPEDLCSAARIEVGQLIPDLDEMILDFQEIGPASSAEGDMVRVMIVAAPRDAVASRMDLLARARFRSPSLVPDGIALANAVAVLRPPEESADLVLDIGRQATVLVAVMPGTEAMAPVVRHVPGGLELLAAVEDTSAVNRHRNETVQDQWLQEIERSIQFVSGKLDTPAQRILVVGAGAYSSDLLDWIKQNLAVPVYRWSPMSYIGRDTGAPPENFLKEHGPHMAVAVGLALMQEV